MEMVYYIADNKGKIRNFFVNFVHNMQHFVNLVLISAHLINLILKQAICRQNAASVFA